MRAVFLVSVARRRRTLQVKITPEVSSRSVNRAIMSELVRLYHDSDLGGRLPAYDGRKNLYTAGTLPFDAREFVVRLTDDDDGTGVPPRCAHYLPTARRSILLRPCLNRHRVSGSAGRGSTGSPSSSPRAPTSTTSGSSSPGARPTRRRRLSRCSTSCSVSLPTAGTHTHCSSSCVLAREKKGKKLILIGPNGRYVSIGRSFYSPDIRKPQRLGDGLQSWCGFYQSIRPTQMGLSLNIGEMLANIWCPHACIFPGCHVLAAYMVDDVDARYVIYRVHRAATSDRIRGPNTREGCHIEAIVGCKQNQGKFMLAGKE